MKLPDFLVIGAQKSGTTSLFLLLAKHPQLFLPSRKELQFFSSNALYERGLDWYSQEFFSDCPADKLAGEVSPQYLYSTREARRIHAALPNAKLIAILREPIDRAYSQYLMSQRRGQETRSLEEAFADSFTIGESNQEAPESVRYFQFSDYQTVLSEYLQLFGREKILILFQEDLDRAPEAVMEKIVNFLGVQNIVPENINVRAHKSGTVRFKALKKLTESDSILRRVLRSLVPRKLRPTIVFWVEIFNIKPVKTEGVPDHIRKQYAGFMKKQVDFLSEAFGLTAPWQNKVSRK